MKKGWKVFWVVCAIMAGIGVAFCIAGVMLGASMEMFWNRFPNGIVIRGFDMDDYINKGMSITPDSSESFTGVHEIDLEVTGIEVEILETTQSDEVRLEAENIDSRLNLRYHMEDGELTITTRKNFVGLGSGHHGTIWLYLPACRMEEIKLELGAGSLYAETLYAESISIDVGAGEAEIDWFEADEVDLDCGVGSLTIAGDFRTEADIDCGVGSIDFAAAGSTHQYNYKIQCGIGKVIIGNNSYTGLGREKKVHNDADKDMNIQCGIGNVSVDFIAE